nr:alpha/beta fold hydrolase [Novosphingobium marinum]
MLREAGRRAALVAGELSKRTTLARQPQPDGVTGPPVRLMLSEIAEFVRRSNKAVHGELALHPQPVMLLPGFAAHPSRMKRMGDSLERAGHEVFDWGLGFNMGPTAENFSYLMRRVRKIAREHDQPVALVGWSLGGLFAREIARRQPEAVGRVITMGTPFSHDPRANNVWRAYQFLTGHPVDSPPIDCDDFSIKPPVTTIALWSARDGVIHPRAACGRKGERDRAVPVRCTHLGFSGDPRVITEVIRQLDWIPGD